ncbi:MULTISPECIES: hypothetical protein [Pseudarthrobacter]|uniref:hypothetical protein n=1 Tax=Pseudarthrobacter TaxID=1742993 RepID=UPI000D420399
MAVSELRQASRAQSSVPGNQELPWKHAWSLLMAYIGRRKSLPPLNRTYPFGADAVTDQRTTLRELREDRKLAAQFAGCLIILFLIVLFSPIPDSTWEDPLLEALLWGALIVLVWAGIQGIGYVPSFGEWIEAQESVQAAKDVKLAARSMPSFTDYFDSWRITSTGVDYFRAYLKWLIWGLVAAVWVLTSLEVLYGISWARTVAASVLLYIFCLLLIRQLVKDSVEWTVAEEIEAEDGRSAALERKHSYRTLYCTTTKIFRWIFLFSAVLSLLVFHATVNLAILGRLSWTHAGLSLGMVIPVLMAYRFSAHLIRSRVSDLDYVKGTSMAREVIVYWVVEAAILTQKALVPADNSLTSSISSSLLVVLSAVAVVRMAGTGYKEYREALVSVKS